VILPVNHLVDGQGFEADSYHTGTHSGWSVIASGYTEEVESDAELRRLRPPHRGRRVRRLTNLSLDTWIKVQTDPKYASLRARGTDQRCD
jgi:hypothetical protein